MFSRVPITISAPLLVGLPVLAVGVLLSLIWNRQSREAITELANQNIEQIHELASGKVSDVLLAPVRVCKVNAHLIRSGKLDPADLSAWRPTLVEEAAAFEALSSIAWGDADGRSAWVSRYADGSFYWALKDDASQSVMREWRLNERGEIPEEPSSTFDFDLYSRPWFIAPREAKQGAWCRPYVWVGGADSGVTLGLSYGIPLYETNGELQGVVDADFSINDLSTFLRSLQIGKTGMAALATADGRLLAASNDTPIVNAENERVIARESSDPLMAAAAKRLADSSSDLNEATVISVNGQRHYLRASPVGQQAGLDWTLLTIVPEQDFIGEIEGEFRRSFLTSLVAVILAAALGLAAARWLVSPLLKLVAAVRKIGEGEFETRVELRHAPEYARLGEAINEMTLGLEDRMKMRESLSLAMEVQRNLLPSEEPEIRGLDIAGHSTYCDETGGDYYDYLDVSGADEQTAVIAVGDVVGHGIAAAMLMATARGILRSRCAVPGSLGDFLDHLNEMLVRDTRGESFMTMLLLTVCSTRQELRWASAGHGPPLIYDSNSQSFPELDGGGLPLGLVAEQTYEEYEQRQIRPGFVLLAATDGLWETSAPDGKLFGMDRLKAIIQEHAYRSAEEISREIREQLAQYRGLASQDDDLTFVIAKVL